MSKNQFFVWKSDYRVGEFWAVAIGNQISGVLGPFTPAFAYMAVQFLRAEGFLATLYAGFPKIRKTDDAERKSKILSRLRDLKVYDEDALYHMEKAHLKESGFQISNYLGDE